jgi:selenocysteine-specific elongation factor
MTDATKTTSFRKIPSLDSLLREDAVRTLIEEFGRDVVVTEGRAAAIGLIERHGSVTIAEFRDRLNLSRKYAQAILEHLDKTGYTKRIEDRHVLAQRPT